MRDRYCQSQVIEDEQKSKILLKIMLINRYVDSLYEDRLLSGKTFPLCTKHARSNSTESSDLDVSSVQDISSFDMSNFDFESFEMCSFYGSCFDMSSLDLSSFDLSNSDVHLAKLTDLSHRLKQVKNNLSVMCNPPFL